MRESKHSVAQRCAVVRRRQRLFLSLVPVARLEFVGGIAQELVRADAVGPDQLAVVHARGNEHEHDHRSGSQAKDDAAPVGPRRDHRIGHEQRERGFDAVVRHPRAQPQNRVVGGERPQQQTPASAKLAAQMQVEEHQHGEQHELPSQRHRKRERVRHQGVAGMAGDHRRIVEIEERRRAEAHHHRHHLGELWIIARQHLDGWQRSRS